MKRIRLLLVIFGLLSTIILPAEQLSFRISAPKIVRSGILERLEFFIQVKADVAGTYLYTGQIEIGYNSSAFTSVATDWLVTNQGAFNGVNTQSGLKYSVTKNNDVPGVLLIGWVSDVNVFTFGPNADDYAEITDVYQNLCKVSGVISTSTVLAGLDFTEVNSNGYWSQISAPSTTVNYTNPNLYDPANFSTLYLGRIYSSLGWSQVGKTTNGSWVDWTTAVNTSIWEGTAAVPTGASNMSALRIHSGATLTIPYTGQLTTAAIDNNTAAGIVIQSNGTGTGSLISGAVTSTSGTGTAIAQRYLAGATAWHLVSSPVKNQDIPLFVAANGIATHGDAVRRGVGYYNSSTLTWVNYTAGTVDANLANDFKQGLGYEVMQTAASGTISFNGRLEYDTYSKTGLTANEWNLVGNPYPSAIVATQGANNFLTDNGTVSAIYIWNPSTSLYEPQNNTAAYNVPAEQAFFIKPTVTSASFTAASRTHTADPFKSGQIGHPNINLKATVASLLRNTKVFYIAGTTVGMDDQYDAQVFDGPGSSATILLSTRMEGNDMDLAIQSLPNYDYENMVVPVGLNAPAGSPVTFTADVANFPAGTKIYLEDRAAGKFTRLDEEGSFYSILTTEAMRGTGRFFLHTKQGTMGIESAIADNYTIIPLPSQHKIRVVGIVKPASIANVYSMSGQLVATEVMHNAGENEIPFTPQSNGIYILKIQTGSTIIEKKINWVY